MVLADGTRVTTTRGVRDEHPRLREILDQVDAIIAEDPGALEAGWPRVRKNSSGYALREYLRSGDAVDLFVGSEGTLGMVTGATVRLAPVPAARGLALLEFTALEAAGAAVHRILELRPATCEMIDRTFIDLVRESGEDPVYPLRAGLEAILFVEMEGDWPMTSRGSWSPSGRRWTAWRTAYRWPSIRTSRSGSGTCATRPAR